MARASRIPRTTLELLEALDHHQFLLRNALHQLESDSAHLKILATELRTLVCLSSGTEGLLWRLVDELGVSDDVELQLGQGNALNRDHPLCRGMEFFTLPMHRPGQGLPSFAIQTVGLREIIKDYEAIYVWQLADRIFTHELLIRAIAEQMGGAHEDNGLEYALVKLNNILINKRQLYVGILALDAELTLQIGERVLDRAEESHGFHRARRPANQGDITFCVRLVRRRLVIGRSPVVTLASLISETELACAATCEGVMFSLRKRGVLIAELAAPYPSKWEEGTEALFALSYSSAHRMARTISNDQPNGDPSDVDLGWVDARELRPRAEVGEHSPVALVVVPLYERLLSPAECGQLLQISPDGRELRSTVRMTGPFPA